MRGPASPGPEASPYPLDAPVTRVAVRLRRGRRRGTLCCVEELRREELRRLALWLSRRREVDEAVAHLTAYGPAASDRVHAHLDALKQLLAAEQDAFRALDAAAPRVGQLPLPTVVDDLAEPSDDGPGGTVHSLLAARTRRLS